MSEDTHWNTGNMIYGDEDEASYENKGSIIKQQIIQRHINEIYLSSDMPSNEKVAEVVRWQIRQLTNEEKRTLKKEMRSYKNSNIEAIGQSGNLYVYALNNPVRYVDPEGCVVYIAGASAAAQCGIRIGVGQAITWDDKGNVGIVDTASWGGGFFGASAGGFYTRLEAPTIEAVQGASFEIGASAGGAVFGGFDYTVTLGKNSYSGQIYSAGLSVGVPVEGHGQISYSNVTSSPLGIAIRFIAGPILGGIINNTFGIK